MALTLTIRLHKHDLTTDRHGRVYLPPQLQHRYVRLQARCSPSTSGAMRVSATDWDLNHGFNACTTPASYK